MAWNTTQLPAIYISFYTGEKIEIVCICKSSDIKKKRARERSKERRKDAGSKGEGKQHG